MITLDVNGQKHELDVMEDMTLLWVLRDRLNLKGTKYGCGEGFCGSCTVLIDNKAVRSCQTSLKEISGKQIITIEGLSQNGELHPLQKAFIKHDALQCGYCTPGMILSAYGLLQANPSPSREEVISYMDDNLCRCGSYNRIVDAILEAADEMEGTDK